MLATGARVNGQCLHAFDVSGEEGVVHPADQVGGLCGELSRAERESERSGEFLPSSGDLLAEGGEAARIRAFVETIHELY
ncbi:hypothetical protein [Streptomyces sp. NPDC056387]|uniref:hypothetical protein n=1 Tax=Streptomyces sp. NPDC056387 TaxID=3345803 RepID=UPI0035DB6219